MSREGEKRMLVRVGMGWTLGSEWGMRGAWTCGWDRGDGAVVRAELVVGYRLRSGGVGLDLVWPCQRRGFENRVLHVSAVLS